VASYTTDGVYRWGHTVGCDTNCGLGASLVVDDVGNIYVAGNFTGSVDFDPGPGTVEKTSSGVTDIFLVAYDDAGSFRYVNVAGGGGFDGANNVALDQNDDVVVTGTFFNTIDLDPGAGTTTITSNGSSDMFLVGYEAGGDIRFGFGIGSSDGDAGTVVDVNTWGMIAVGGVFKDTVDFDPDPTNSEERTSAGSGDGYVALYDEGDIVLTRNEAELPISSSFELSVFPNPVRSQATLRLDAPLRQFVNISVYDVLGRRVKVLHSGELSAGTHVLVLETSGLAPGIYIIRCSSGEFVCSQPVTVVRW